MRISKNTRNTIIGIAIALAIVAVFVIFWPSLAF